MSIDEREGKWQGWAEKMRGKQSPVMRAGAGYYSYLLFCNQISLITIRARSDGQGGDKSDKSELQTDAI